MKKYCNHNWKLKKPKKLLYNRYRSPNYFELEYVCKKCLKEKTKIIESE